MPLVQIHLRQGQSIEFRRRIGELVYVTILSKSR
jgi:hypothetical protein